MTALYYALGVVLFVGAILVSIGLHELGHMIPAKRFGGKVSQYFIGFGPTVWSKQVGETEYGVKAIPLGGYVKIIGMLPPGAADLADEVTLDAEGNTVTRVRKSNTGMFTQLISDARAAEWELIKPEDTDRLFYKMPSWKKVVVMAGGPTVNILIAFFIFWGVFATYGQKSYEPEAGQPVLESVSVCVLPYAEEGRDCEASDPRAPAYEAGLRPGDVITTFNGTAVTNWDQLRELILGDAAEMDLEPAARPGRVIFEGQGVAAQRPLARPQPGRGRRPDDLAIAPANQRRIGAQDPVKRRIGLQHNVVDQAPVSVSRRLDKGETVRDAFEQGPIAEVFFGCAGVLRRPRRAQARRTPAGRPATHSTVVAATWIGAMAVHSSGPPSFSIEVNTLRAINQKASREVRMSRQLG